MHCLYFNKYFFPVQKIQQQPYQQQCAQCIAGRLPSFSYMHVPAFKQQPGTVIKIYEPDAEIDDQGVHANYFKKESPFTELQYVYRPVKESEEQKSHPGSKQNE